MSRTALAFMSYVNLDDQHEQGRLTRFRECLSGEVRMQTGKPFDIFQDREDIAWGQPWEKRIHESLAATTFLIPIITPAFFKSNACRKELKYFLKREEELGRGDLILPVYYVRCPVLEDKAKREHDKLAQVLAARQYADWRELRFEEFTSSSVRKALAKMAEQIVAALERSEAEASCLQPEKDDSTPASSNTFTKTGRGDQSIAQGNNAIGTQINNYYAPPPSESRPQLAPTVKTDPPTLVIDPLYRCDYATITAALKAAEPGTRILVRPGLYKESIVIDKPVEIIGDGERSEIIIQLVGNPAILSKTDIGRVANLTLNDIRIEQGRLEIEDCDISSKGNICVQILNDADPILRRCHIHDGPAAGVLICNNGKGLIEHNEIFSNAQGGIIINTTKNPILRFNRISKNGWSGVRICDGGGGIIEDNDLQGNTKGAWYIEEGCAANVQRRGNKE